MDKKIKILGIGGGAQNVIDYLFTNNKHTNVEFVVINSDAAKLEKAKTERKFVIADGLGCLINIETAETYAKAQKSQFLELFKDTDFAILVSAFGGGCGTGATPVIAEILKEQHIPVIAIVTKPIHYEGDTRRLRAFEGIENLNNFVDKCIIIDSQTELNNITSERISLRKFFECVDNKIVNIVEDELNKL